MPKKTAVVTGVARHSLGEAFIRKLADREPEANVIGIDRVVNPDLAEIMNFRQLLLDLNPLHYLDGVGQFAMEFGQKLADLLASTDASCVNYLIQCAGVYDFGNFLEHDVERRERVLGLNILGTTEVLHGVMALNERFHSPNNKELTHVLVGSFQGLYARGQRPLYAPSKAYGIDLCTSLVDGHELAKCLYVAPIPIDTPMLHRNHWVSKAQGSVKFFEHVLEGTSEEYKAIFVCCDEAVLEDVARKEFQSEIESLRATFVRYKNARIRAHSKKVGLLSREVCAAALADLTISRESTSGVYLLTTDNQKSGISIKVAPFLSLDRRPMLFTERTQ